MDAKHLRTFVTIVDLQSFTRAGRRLGISQSAISQQIRALEKQLGVPILTRSGSGARPTPAGDLLLQYARQILRKIEEAERVLADLESSPRGLLRIGAGGAACHFLLPPVLREFCRRFPRVELRVTSGPTAHTVERLLAGELDVGLVTLPLAEPKLSLSELGNDELVAIAPPGHAWSERRRIQAADFAGEPLLVYERRTQAYHLIERTLLEAGVLPRIAMEMDQLEAVVEMVCAGLGVAIVPRWAVTAEHASGRLCMRPIGKNGLVRRWALALPSAQHRTQAVKAFMRLCQESLPPLLEGNTIGAPH